MYITTGTHKCTTHTLGELGKHCSCSCRNHSNTQVRGPQFPREEEVEEERAEERRGEEEEKMKTDTHLTTMLHDLPGFVGAVDVSFRHPLVQQHFHQTEVLPVHILHMCTHTHTHTQMFSPCPGAYLDTLMVFHVSTISPSPCTHLYTFAFTPKQVMVHTNQTSPQNTHLAQVLVHTFIH